MPANPNARARLSRRRCSACRSGPSGRSGSGRSCCPRSALLLLVRRTVDRLEPGLGVAAAAILGLATLVLPFSTLLFAHVPAAALAFLSFALLFGRDRSAAAASPPPALPPASRSPPICRSPCRPSCSGSMRPRGTPRSRALAAFARGRARRPAAALGLQPLGVREPVPPRLLRRASSPGAGGWSRPAFFGLHAQLPSFRVARRAAAEPARAARRHAGRRGRRRRHACCSGGAACARRPALIAALIVVELIWNSARQPTAFALGGWSPGPRFLIPLLPFLCFALAPALRRAARDGRRARARVGRRDGGRDERRAAAPERRHPPLALAHRPRQLHGDRRQPRRRRPRLARDHSLLRRSCSSRPRPRSPRRGCRSSAATSPWPRPRSSPGSSSSTARPSSCGSTARVHQSYGLLAAILLVGRLRAGPRSGSGPRGSRCSPFATIRTADHTKWALLLVVLVLVALAVSERVRRAPVPA